MEYSGIDSENNSTYTFFQKFGDKVVREIDNPFSLDSEKITRPYNPEEDGPLQTGQNDLKWNLVSRKDGQPFEEGMSEAERFKNSANEVLFLAKGLSLIHISEPTRPY